MGIKIRKKVKEGPRGHYAIPLALAIACFFGPRRETRDFRKPIEGSGELGFVLTRYCGFEIIVADRPLSLAEFTHWDLKARPGKLAEMFWKDGSIPMGPATGHESEQFTILPVIAMGRGAKLKGISNFLGKELPEVTQVAIQNILFPAFGLIPGFDLCLYFPPVHLRALDKAFEGLSVMVKEEFEKANLTHPEYFPTLPKNILKDIPLQDPFSRTARR
jgi:hypothetical protein